MTAYIHFWTIWYYFRPRGVAVVASCHFVLVWEVISEPTSRASKFESLHYLTTSVWLRPVNKEGLFTCRTKQVFECMWADVSFVQTDFI
jgi:hypothetical protein